MTVAAGTKRVAANPSGARKKLKEDKDKATKRAKKEEEEAEELEEEIEEVPSDLEEDEEEEEEEGQEQEVAEAATPDAAEPEKEYITKGCMLAQTVIEADAAGKLNVVVSKDGNVSITIGAKGALRGDLGPWVCSLSYLRKFGTCHAPKPQLKEGEDPKKQRYSMHTPIEDAWKAKHKIVLNTNYDAFEAMSVDNPNNGQVRADLTRVEKEWREMMDVLSTRIINAIWEHPVYAPTLRANVLNILDVANGNKEVAANQIKKNFKKLFLPNVLEAGETPPITLFIDRAAVSHDKSPDACIHGPEYDPAKGTWSQYFQKVWPNRSPIITSYTRPNDTEIKLGEVANPAHGEYSYNDELITPGSIVNVNMLLTIGVKVDKGMVVPVIQRKLTRADQAPVQILYRPPPGTHYSYKNEKGAENGAVATGGYVPEKKQSFANHYGDAGI